jgi:hypothetical protein
MKTNIRLILEHAPERITDIGRFNEGGCHLVQKWREEIVVIFIDQGDMETKIAC